mgnify:CR=1 FL=1
MNAISCFERALSLKPDYAEAVDNKGAILQVQGRFDEAIPCHLKAIELCDRYTSAHYNLGNAFYKAGRLEEAAQDLRKACEMGQALACFAAKRMEPAENFR